MYLSSKRKEYVARELEVHYFRMKYILKYIFWNVLTNVLTNGLKYWEMYSQCTLVSARKT